MKKFCSILLILTLSFSLLLSSCKKKGKNKKDDDNATIVNPPGPDDDNGTIVNPPGPDDDNGTIVNPPGPNDDKKFTLSLSLETVNILIGEEKEVSISSTDVVDLSNLTLNYDSSIISVVNDGAKLTIKGLKKGNTKVDISLSGYEETYHIDVDVEEGKEMIAEVITNKVPETMFIGESFILSFTTNVTVTAMWNSTNPDCIELGDNDYEFIAVGKGESTISLILTTKDDSVVKNWTIKVEEKVIDTISPVLSLDGVEKDIKLSWGKVFNPLEGIKATDDIDGDITDKISVDSNVNSKEYGKYIVKYSVKDKAGNAATLERSVEVVWDYAVKFIGHAGSYFGAQNSEEACVYALSVLKYQSLECDLKRTKDGVFVCSHNDSFNGTDGNSYTIANYTLAELQEKTFKEKRAGGSSLVGVADKTYEFKVMTLQRYLEICKQYNAVAIIELKGCAGVSQNDQTGMPALMKLIDDCGMMNQTIFLASAYNCLIWARDNGYNLPCQYLMNTCDSEDAYNRCVKYHLDISICVTYGNYTDKFTAAEREAYKTNWIRRYQAAGCEVSVWTFTQYCTYQQVQEWIDFGVDWVTCDWQQMDKLKLPEGNLVTHKVTFLKHDGTLLQEVTVKDGKSCYTPKAPEREDYEFIGWGQDLSKITKDITVTAQYKAIPHKWNITYDLNGGYFDLNPRVEGEKIGSVTTNANANYYTDYLKNVFLYNINKIGGDTAIYSYRVYLKEIKNGYYEIVDVLLSGSPNLSSGWDYLIQVNPSQADYSAISKVCNKAAKGGIAYINGDPQTGKVTIDFYAKESIKGLVVENYITYYETPSTPCALPIPSMDGKMFVGWKEKQEDNAPMLAVPEGYAKDLVLVAVFE